MKFLQGLLFWLMVAASLSAILGLCALSFWLDHMRFCY